MEGLDFDSILGEDEIDDLFGGPEEETPRQERDAQEEKGPEGGEKKDDAAEAVDPEALFEDEQPESVGSEEKKEEHKGKEEPEPDRDAGASPNNFYSSIANALTEEGIFPDLDNETIKKVDIPVIYVKQFNGYIY